MVIHAVFVCDNSMKWINKLLIALTITFFIGAGAVLAILNPQLITINLWGWLTVEHTVAVWSLMMVVLGILIGVGLAFVLIIKLQSQLYMHKRRVNQLQSVADSNKESKK